MLAVVLGVVGPRRLGGARDERASPLDHRRRAGRRRARRHVPARTARGRPCASSSLLGASVSLAGSIVALRQLRQGQSGLQRVEDFPLVPSLGVHLRLAQDGWGGPLLLLTGVIIFAGVLASWTLNKRDKEYFVLLLVLVSGVFGVFVSQDLLVFFLFYEIAVLPMYLLIGIWGSSHAVPGQGPVQDRVEGSSTSATSSTPR